MRHLLIAASSSILLAALLPMASFAGSPLPEKIGEVFIVDDFDHDVTRNDLGFNHFAGNAGVTETATGIARLELSADSNGSPGGSLDFSFDFEGQPEESFAGYFASLFGLTDTLVSLDGSGDEPPTPTPFPGYFVDTLDFYRESLAFPDQDLEQLRFDLRLLSGEDLVLRIELRDESGFDVFTRRTVSGGSWQTLTFELPDSFDQSLAGDPSGFDWRRVSVFTVLVERRNLGAQIENPSSGRFLLDNLVLVDLDGTYPDLEAPALTDTEGRLREEYHRAFLEQVERTSSLYFLDFASTDPRTGSMAQDRSVFADLMSLGGAGFQLNSYCADMLSGYLPRADAAARALGLLQALHDRPQGPARVGTLGYRGFFYHFAGIDGLRKQNFDFVATPELDESQNTVEVSTIDTALAVAGVVTTGQCFDGVSSIEAEIRQLADAIYARVDWPFLLEPLSRQFYLGWKPNESRDDTSGLFGRFLLDDAEGLGQYSSRDAEGVEIPATIDFYTDEGLLIALLAMGSPNPDHRLGRDVWDAMIRDFDGGDFIKTFPGSLFTYEFAAVWLDIEDLGADSHPAVPIDFFLNTRRAILATRDYALANPDDRATWREGQGAYRWGLSAAEGPFDDYFAHAAPSAALARDGGPVAPAVIRREGEGGTGDGIEQPRSAASGQATIWLQAGEARSFAFETPTALSFEIDVRYSNDNFGPLESIGLLLDAAPVASFSAQDTGNFGFGWNVFVTEEGLGPAQLEAGEHNLRLEVSGGDGFGVEIDRISLTSDASLRPLADGTVTVYGAGSALPHAPDLAVDALWEAYQLGLLHPRFGFADAFNLDISDAASPTSEGLRYAGFWANFVGFAIDHGPMRSMIDNHLVNERLPRLFMSHPGVRRALLELFPSGGPARIFSDGFESGDTTAW